MGAPFESEEATTVQVHRPVVGTVRRVLLLLLALWTGANSYSFEETFRNIGHWWAQGRTESFPIQNTSSLIVHLVAFGLLGGLLLRLRRRKPRVPAHVRGDERGLSSDGVLVVAREEIASVEVTTDPDLGFATVILTRKGESVVVPLRTERAAHALAAALASEHDETKLVFEGVSGSRARETGMAVVAATLLLALAVVPTMDFIPEHFFRALEGRYGDGPYTVVWWVWWLVAFAPITFGGLASLPVSKSIARRLRRGRVVVHGTGVSVGQREIAVDDIAAVETGGDSAVSVALRNGQSIRAAFAADRPVVERDLFVTRVRELIARTPAPSYPSAETSGVRVALSPSPEEEPPEEASEDVPERRATRRR